MQDVESYGIISKEKKTVMLTDRIVAYLAVLFVLASLIISCIGINMGSQSSLEKSLYTFSFPYFTQIPKVDNGMVVSLNKKGEVWTGAGTTISQNVTVVETQLFKGNIRVCAYNQNIIFAAVSGKIIAYEISYDDISLENESYTLGKIGGEEINAKAMFRFGNTLVVAGNGHLIPVAITVEEVSETKVKFTFKEGRAEKFTDEQKNSAYCDNLSDHDRNYVACTWEEGEDLWTMVAGFDNGEFKIMDKKKYGSARAFHGIAGLGPMGYIVAATGHLKNDTSPWPDHIYLTYVEVRDGGLFFSNVTEVKFGWTYGFFAIDNLHRNGAVMCFSNAVSGGINCLGIDVTHKGKDTVIQLGSSVRVSKGGSAMEFSRTKLQPINDNTFAVIWSDKNVGGALSYQMVTFNNAGDMVKNGPSFVVSSRNRNNKILEHAVGSSAVDNYKSFIVELVGYENGDNKAFLHTVYVYPRPIGIAGKSFVGSNQVQFGGLWKVTKKAAKVLKKNELTPGRMYYTNDRGMVLEGWPAGYAHRSFGINYMTSRSDESLLGLGNQVGMAVSKKEILLKFH